MNEPNFRRRRDETLAALKIQLAHVIIMKDVHYPGNGNYRSATPGVGNSPEGGNFSPPEPPIIRPLYICGNPTNT